MDEGVVLLLVAGREGEGVALQQSEHLDRAITTGVHGETPLVLVHDLLADVGEVVQELVQLLDVVLLHPAEQLVQVQTLPRVVDDRQPVFVALLVRSHS